MILLTPNAISIVFQGGYLLTLPCFLFLFSDDGPDKDVATNEPMISTTAALQIKTSFSLMPMDASSMQQRGALMCTHMPRVRRRLDRCMCLPTERRQAVGVVSPPATVLT